MGKGGMVHLMSPATAAASALAGKIVNSGIVSKDRKRMKILTETYFFWTVRYQYR